MGTKPATIFDLLSEYGAPSEPYLRPDQVTRIHKVYFPVIANGEMRLLCRVSGVDNEGKEVAWRGALLKPPALTVDPSTLD